jgi:hypothetical protein
MNQKFSTIALIHENAIYAGKWCCTPHSVTVRYRQREVSISAGGKRQNDVAKALLTELIEAASQEKVRPSGAGQSASPFGGRQRRNVA